jgi:hypothetical protein
MILGIGSDLCDIRRIERSLARFGERFTHRVFTEGERARSDGGRRARRILRPALRRQGGLRQGARHRHERGRVLAPPDRAGDPHGPVPALQHPLRLDEGDAAGRRLSVRLEIFLRLQPLLDSASRRRCSRAASSARSRSAATSSVFRLPKDDSTDYIKRVIGLPGDRIQMKDGVLYINDSR